MKGEIFIYWGSLRNHSSFAFKFTLKLHFLLRLFKGRLQGDLRAPSST